MDWGATAVWLVSFGLVAYLGLKGGGYDPLVHNQVGIVVWWLLLAGVLVAAIPRGLPPRLAWCALALLAGFTAWTALSLIWTESGERTFADLARIATYLGVFALAVFTRRSGEARRLIGAVAAGVVLVSIIALLSRFHPTWFPGSQQTGHFLTTGRERLSYPINYWNGLAALMAIGLPLLLQIAAEARLTVLRCASAAAVPAVALTIYYTFSRGGVAAAAIAVIVFLLVASDRVPKLLTLLVTGAGAAVLIAAANQRGSLRHGLQSSTAHHQGNEMLALTIAVCVAVALVQGALSLGLAGDRRPAWTHVSPRRSLAALVVGLVALLVAAAIADVPGRAADGWREFKEGGQPGHGTARLTSVAGENRYQFWSSAVRENATDPLIGTGSGTFQFWWPRDGESSESVRDTHSLYMQTLGELGIIGLLILAAFLLVLLIGGARSAVRAGFGERSVAAAALAGVVAFCLVAVVDWIWQIPVLAVALLLLGSILVTDGTGGRAAALPLPFRLAFVPAALIAIAVIAISLASTSLVRSSQADVREGNLTAALDAAKSAQNAEPWAATPRLQQALVLEAQGSLGPAAEAARAAAERESTNWRTWLVLSRIEAERGRAEAAVSAYRRARSLNPRSEIFER